MILDTLAGLSDAEQFFDALAVPYDPAVVEVHRLHILKRFRDLIPAGADEAGCRDALARAHADFASGQGRKSFKVFRDAAPGFVPLDAVAAAITPRPPRPPAE